MGSFHSTSIFDYWANPIVHLSLLKTCLAQCSEESNDLEHIFAVVTHEERLELLPPVLPSFVRFCKAFPPITEDVISLLVKVNEYPCHLYL